MAGFPKTVLLPTASSYVVLNPKDKSLVWASSPFARHYLGIRCFFLFLRLLRCFSSPGSLRMTMDSSYGDRSSFCRVSPFGYLRINGYLLLPAAFRSLSRPSSAPGAKASALRPCNLDLSWDGNALRNISGDASLLAGDGVCRGGGVSTKRLSRAWNAEHFCEWPISTVF